MVHRCTICKNKIAKVYKCESKYCRLTYCSKICQQKQWSSQKAWNFLSETESKTITLDNDENVRCAIMCRKTEKPIPSALQLYAVQKVSARTLYETSWSLGEFGFHFVEKPSLANTICQRNYVVSTVRCRLISWDIVRLIYLGHKSSHGVFGHLPKDLLKKIVSFINFSAIFEQYVFLKDEIKVIMDQVEDIDYRKASKMLLHFGNIVDTILALTD
jgi:hypothetical protein